MADGIQVLGNSVEKLAYIYTEVLNRAEMCNFTFKPSKVIVCPKNITLFGWNLRGTSWHPTSHTISALTNAPTPTTIKQLHSFLGSFKQLSSSLPGYAVVIHDLEQLVGWTKVSYSHYMGRNSSKSFPICKNPCCKPHHITETRPYDQLYTFSDYWTEHNAVGARLVIICDTETGTQEHVGGFFNAVLDKSKKRRL